MRAPSKKLLTEEQRSQAAMAAARDLVATALPQVAEMMGAVPVTGPSTGCVALPLAGQQTMIGATKARPNWYEVGRKEIDALARLVVERNWFARPVHEARVGVYAYGFRFADAEANKWARAGTYDFAGMQMDMLHEWHISNAIIAWWRKDAEEGTLPRVNVARAGEVEYDVVGGIAQITLTIPRKPIKESLKEVIGERMWNCIRNGKKLVIMEGDEEFDFKVMKSGKSSDKLQASPLVTILEDLDFIDAIRVGDWNGAKARWEIIRQAKKGYSPGSGNNAGSVKNKATRPELEALLKALVGIFGKTNMPTNFDVELLWHIFPKEHFHPDLLREVKQRLIFWSGIFGVLLLETESKMTGISDLMLSKLRTEVEVFREDFGRFLRSIYRSDSFRNGIENMPELDPVWSVKPLYSIDAFTKYCTMLATYGLAAPATLREMCDIDDSRESERMLESHSRPKEYTPPFEPRQGIASGFTVPDTGGGSEQDQNLPGEGGRPAEIGD